MGGIRIVTDTCACLPEPLVAENSIIRVPYYIHMAGRMLRDLVEVLPGPFFTQLVTADELPKTSNPGPGDYLAAFLEAAEDGAEGVVSVQMTSHGSGGYQAALVAKEMAATEIPQLQVEVVDTRNVAMCQGWIALQAARAANAGASLMQVMSLIRQLLPRVRLLQTADTLRYLYMGGRIGRAQHLVGSLLNIKPIISMEDGVIVALGQARSRLAAYKRIVEHVAAAVAQGGQLQVAYLHAAALDEVRQLRSLLEERLTPVESLVAELCPALGVHTGPGTVGICYLRTP
ncbi:MAG: DegV family protein [Anaerolineae bacterium]